ncbi:MAG TPA: hypothetical protein VGR00_14950, partial [Thermoanaerobaculia bacterium]|nr:hypothetical protein [Thermoanaerobaculia bacterium]
QMIRTAVAMAETGELGQARGAALTVLRPSGDAVSRYGMGMSFAQLPAALLAAPVERALGPGTSQPLFLVAPLLLVLLAAWAAGRAARLLGAGPKGEAAAILLAGLGSPLASYAALEYSEPLQAAALAVAFAASLESRAAASRRRALGAAAVAGAAASVAVLTKSSLLVTVPFALLPLVASSAVASLVSRLAASAAGAAPGLLTWVAFDVVRFGRPLGGYGGEGFTHPPLDGLFRLLVGPNRGIVFFFPAVLLVLFAAVKRTRGARREELVPAAGALGTFATLLLVASAWWAWHGVGGWGPRLLVPALPVLAAYAGLALDGVSQTARRVVVGGSIALNVLPLVQHPTPVDIYVYNCRPSKIDPGTVSEYPAFGVSHDAAGAPLVRPTSVLAKMPQASPFVVLPWFFSTSLVSDPAEKGRRLDRPPWFSVRPDLVPTDSPIAPDLAPVIAPSPRLAFFGRGFLGAGPDANRVYDDSLTDQVLRALQIKNAERALRLAEKLASIAPGESSDAYQLESYRLLGRVETASAFVGSLPPERRAAPRVGLVLALFARDRGDESSARRFLGAVAGAFPGTPAESAAAKPLAEWPATLAEMLAVAEVDDTVARPGRPAR